MYHEEQVASLSIWEREWTVGDLDRVEECHHAIGQNLKRARQDWSWGGKDTRLNALYEQQLDPVEYHLNLARGVLEGAHGLAVEAPGIYELEVECLHFVEAFDVVVYLLELCKGRRMQHAEETHELPLEGSDALAGGLGHPAEGEELAAGVKPLRPHLVRGGAAAPKARVGLRGPEDNQEADESAEARPRLRLTQDAVALRPWYVAHVDQDLEPRRQEPAGKRDKQGRGEDAALHLH
mmetsp:Transcript_9909/g.26939  ORF Transcript_9909/g.26939 Transcript_9909/m.26939 type:complete len:237 (+) Transcript_9909:923-1633(+)